MLFLCCPGAILAISFFFFFNDTATTEIYTLSLHDALPIWSPDYVKLAEAYGIPGWRVKQASEVTDALRQANESPGPTLVELVIEQEANVFPMIVPGGSLSEPLEAAPV